MSADAESEVSVYINEGLQADAEQQPARLKYALGFTVIR